MRVQIAMDEVGVGRLAWIKRQTGCSTLKEVFNNAITLLLWAVRQRMAGLTIAAIDEEKDEFRELQMPALDHAAEHPMAEPTNEELVLAAGQH